MTQTTVRIVFAALVVFAGARGADAQVLGYGVGGLAGVSGFFNTSSGFSAAGGGEALVAGLAGVGAEAGVFGNVSSVLTAVSVNGVVHLAPSRREHKVSPFVTSGWTRMSSGEGSFDAWNVGGGVDLWAKERVGVRLEFRDHVRPDPRGNVQYWTIRGGIVFR